MKIILFYIILIIGCKERPEKTEYVDNSEIGVFTISGDVKGVVNQALKYTAKDCAGTITWVATGQSNQSGLLVTYTFNEVGTYIIQANCERGSTLVSQALTVNIENPIPEPKMPENPVPEPKPENPVPEPKPENPVPEPKPENPVPEPFPPIIPLPPELPPYSEEPPPPAWKCYGCRCYPI